MIHCEMKTLRDSIAFKLSNPVLSVFMTLKPLGTGFASFARSVHRHSS